jgi:hypothetical protein
MIGAEIVIGVIIGVLFEVTSNTEGTPSEQGSDSNPGKVKTPVRTIELAIAALGQNSVDTAGGLTVPSISLRST